jgi:hypothetical protein
MSERDDRYDLPSTTAEFRATPDLSASTAQFKAFAAGQDVRDQRAVAGSWPEQPAWAGGSTNSNRNRKIYLAIGILIVLAAMAAFFIIS